jgi:hypothetical protein
LIACTLKQNFIFKTFFKILNFILPKNIFQKIPANFIFTKTFFKISKFYFTDFSKNCKFYFQFKTFFKICKFLFLPKTFSKFRKFYFIQNIFKILNFIFIKFHFSKFLQFYFLTKNIFQNCHSCYLIYLFKVVYCSCICTLVVV